MTIRLISQSKTLHCYLILSVWILLVIAGAYKYFDPNQNNEIKPIPIITESFLGSGIEAPKTKRILRICSFPEDIEQGGEGLLNKNDWLLKGLIIVVRHGDRGPLEHVQDIENINCNSEETHILKGYKSYLHNLTITGKLQWTGPGPFHSFPVLPQNLKLCQLGQLTMQGISQHLTLGQLLRASYQEVWPKLRRLTSEEILVYSTRYRRTFQSALAFLYGFISSETLTKVSIMESQSMSFCFKDCECPVTDHLKRLVQKSESRQLKSHPAIETLSQSTGKLLLSSNVEQTNLLKDPNVIRDALMTFVCHRSGLPCDSLVNCIRKQNVAGIISYTDWVNYQKSKNVYWRRLCLLRSYGQIRHIVQQMLHMISSNSPSLVLHSGHDFTLFQLATTLGLLHDPLLLRYASRLIFEVYQDNRPITNEEKGIYFRLLSNGKDVTKQISFCKNIVSVGKKMYVCKIEDIVRFLHDDYFGSLNVTNLKDACAKKREKNSENELFQFR